MGAAPPLPTQACGTKCRTDGAALWPPLDAPALPPQRRPSTLPRLPTIFFARNTST